MSLGYVILNCRVKGKGNNIMQRLDNKDSEHPVKGKCKWYKEINQTQFNKIHAIHNKKQYFGGVSSWGKIVNNSCIVYEINSHSRIEIESHSFNNSGINTRYYLIVK